MTLWVVGSYVLDVAMELELADLYANDPGLEEAIRMEGDRLLVDPELRISVDVHGHDLSFRVASDAPTFDRHQVLRPGSKYELRELPRTDAESGSAGEPGVPRIRAIPRQVAWGGGGLNLVTTVRDVSPPSRTPNVKFTAISHHWRLKTLIDAFRSLLRATSPGLLDLPLREVLEVTREAAVLPAESLVRRIARELRSFGPDLNVVEWALARRRIRFDFHRDGILQPLEAPGGHSLLLPRTNLVISRITSERVDLKDKIIFKSPPPLLEDSLHRPPAGGETREEADRRRERWRERTATFVEEAFEDDAFLALNSVGDAALLEELVEEHRARRADDPGRPAGVLALTETNQAHLPFLLEEDRDGRRIGAFSIILNDRELAAMVLDLLPLLRDRPGEEELGARVRAAVERYGGEVAAGEGAESAESWLDEGGETARRLLVDALAPISRRRPRLAQAVELLDLLRAGAGVESPLYLTLGSHGSVCLDPDDVAWYAQIFRGPERGYDTTGLGDAWAATITLLLFHEARARRRPDVYDHAEALDALEAKDHLKVASAVAYCKYTNPFGRVFLPRLLHVLRTRYLPVAEIGRLDPDRDGPAVLEEGLRERARGARFPETAERAMTRALRAIIETE